MRGHTVEAWRRVEDARTRLGLSLPALYPQQAKLGSFATIQERNAEILAAFDAGETLDAIGHRHGITRERVRQIAKKAGKQPRMVDLHANQLAKLAKAEAKRVARDDRYRAIEADLRAGMFQTDVALRHGVTVQTVWETARLLAKQPKRRHASHRYTLAQRQDARDALIAGEKPRSVSIRLNMSLNTIRQMQLRIRRGQPTAVRVYASDEEAACSPA